MKKDIALFKILLQLDTCAVGVKFFKEEADYLRDTSREIVKKMPYCVAVKCATKGHAVKLNQKTSGCPGSSRALGLRKPGADYYSGERGYKMGLYETVDVAASVANDFCILDHDYYGVAVKPLEAWSEAPDCVLVIADSYTAMRIVQGYTYHFGVQPGFKMTGNQGICVECTAYPFVHGVLNVSTLCAGTRHNCKWKESDMAVGMPFSIFSKVVDGIYHTANATEPDDKKRIIKQALQRHCYDDSNIIVGDAYYLRR